MENQVDNEDKYVKRFMIRLKEHKKHIYDKDETLFKESIFILINVDFKHIWENSELSDNNKEKIWEVCGWSDSPDDDNVTEEGT